MAPGVLASDGVACSCPVSLSCDTVQLLSGARSGQNWGFMLLAFVPGGVSSDIQLSLEDKNGTPGHLRAHFQQSVKAKYRLYF